MAGTNDPSGLPWTTGFQEHSQARQEKEEKGEKRKNWLPGTPHWPEIAPTLADRQSRLLTVPLAGALARRHGPRLLQGTLG